MKITTSFKKIAGLRHKNKVIQGSQGAGKTFSILLIWILKAIKSKEKQFCSIVSATLPQLRDGAIKDFENICLSLDIPYSSTKSPFVFKINKWVFQFMSVDKEIKAVGGRRDRLFINEANRLSWPICRQLINRTHHERIFDFNPTLTFWAHEKFVDIGRCDFLKLTYNDNEELPESEKEDIEIHAPWGKLYDENFWRVFGLGEIGFVEGQIFKGYGKYSTLPEGEYQESIGIDFGWEDPLAAIKVFVDHKKKRIFWKELFYASNVKYSDFEASIKNNPDFKNDNLVCDHEPRDILTLRNLGFKAYKANKKSGIMSDIRAIKQYELFVHEGSSNLINELDNWKYQKNTSSNSSTELYIDFPDQKCKDHAIDAARYGTTWIIRK